MSARSPFRGRSARSVPFVELVGGPFDGTIVFLGQPLEGDLVSRRPLQNDAARHEADWTYASTGEVNATGNAMFTYRPRDAGHAD